MSQCEELARISDAERLLCAEAGPVLNTVVRSIETRAGVIVGEFRVTFDRTNGNSGFPVANCTIVQANVVLASESDSSGAEASTSDESMESTDSPNPAPKSAGE